LGRWLNVAALALTGAIVGLVTGSLVAALLIFVIPVSLADRFSVDTRAEALAAILLALGLAGAILFPVRWRRRYSSASPMGMPAGSKNS